MSMGAREYEETKEAIEGLRRQHAQAGGALAELKKQMVEEFGYRDVAAAEQEIKRLQRQIDAAHAKADAELKKVMAKYKKELDRAKARR